jgi:hypothetical protein
MHFEEVSSVLLSGLVRLDDWSAPTQEGMIMSIHFRCPECNGPVHFNNELAGLHGHCPHCYATIPVPAAEPVAAAQAAAAPEAASANVSGLEHEPVPFRHEKHLEWEPARYSRPREFYPIAPSGTEALAWRTMPRALQLTLAGVLVAFASIVGMGVSEAQEWSTRHAEGRTVPIGTVFFLCLLAAGVVLYLGGQALSCLVSPATRLRSLAISSLVSLAIAAALGVIAVLWFYSWEKLPGGQPPWRTPMFLVIAGMAILVGIVGQSLVVFFLRGVASSLDNKALARSLLRWLVVLGIVLVAIVGLEVMAELMADQPGGDRGAGLAAHFAEVALFALALAWFAVLVYRTRQTVTAEIQAHVNRRPEPAAAP